MKYLDNEKVKELIVDFRDGNEESFEIILNNFQNQIFYFVNKYNYSAIPYEKTDIEIELKLALLEAVQKYDLESSVDFHVYLYGLCVHKISRLFRKYKAQKRNKGIQFYFEEEIGSGGSFTDVISDSYNFEKEYLSDEFVKSKLEEIRGFLNFNDFSIYLMYIEGNSCKQIASHYAMDPVKMKSKIAYIKRKVRQKIKN